MITEKLTCGHVAPAAMPTHGRGGSSGVRSMVTAFAAHALMLGVHRHSVDGSSRLYQEKNTCLKARNQEGLHRWREQRLRIIGVEDEADEAATAKAHRLSSPRTLDYGMMLD